MPVDLWPVMQHRMDGFRESPRWGAWLKTNPELVDQVLAQVRDRGASTARDLDDGAPREKVDWGWNWSETRKALDYLFVVGDLAIAGRNAQFEPVYDLPERVLPPAVLAAPVPDAVRGDQGADPAGGPQPRRGHGALPARLLPPPAAAGRGHQGGPASRSTSWSRTASCCPVTIEGWKRPAYLHRDAALPRKVDARALLSPFDPVVWERERTEHLFDFHYRIEIYVPEPKRQYGYYVLPFLLGDRIVGRVDLKADRKAGALLVKAAYAEPGAPAETADELAAELRDLASWLDLDDIVVHDQG